MPARLVAAARSAISACAPALTAPSIMRPMIWAFSVPVISNSGVSFPLMIT